MRKHYDYLVVGAGLFGAVFAHEAVKAGFTVLTADEAFRPIRFYDVGAFVWFARIIEWEFPGFSVENCFDRLLRLQSVLETDGRIEGTTHRFLIAARKPA